MGLGFLLRQDGDHLAVKFGIDVAVAHFGLHDLVVRLGHLDLEFRFLDGLLLLGAHLCQLRGGIAAAGVGHIRVSWIGIVRVVRVGSHVVRDARSVKELEGETTAHFPNVHSLPDHPGAHALVALRGLDDHVVGIHGNGRLLVRVFRSRCAGMLTAFALGGFLRGRCRRFRTWLCRRFRTRLRRRLCTRLRRRLRSRFRSRFCS